MQRPQAYTQRQRRSARGGFTMVELLVVVTVIAILVGLLVPAVFKVQSTVRNTAVQSEVNRIAAAVTQFKTDYGVEPPSYILLEETGGANGANWDPRSRALLRQMWPQFAFAQPNGASYDRDINGDGDTNDGRIRLDASETLVFFLGGMPVPDPPSSPTSFSLVGFTKNPQDPFVSWQTPNANRAKSAYDFEAGRLRDGNGNGMPEFLDSYPGQQMPLVYFTAYDGTNYRLADYPGNWPALPNPPTPPGAGPVDVKFPVNWYMQGKTATSPPFNAKSFQIISPGKDAAYGPGGPYVAGDADPLPAWSRTTTPAVTVTAADRFAERDNITSFGNGLLVP